MGYVGCNLSQNLISKGWKIAGTCTSEIKKDKLKKMGFDISLFPKNTDYSSIIKKIHESTHILFSIPPNDFGDPAYNIFRKELIKNHSIKWAAYLSSTGVYGNHSNSWVNEESKTLTVNQKSLRRIVAESQWISLFKKNKFPIQIFRLSGIYGPRRDSFLISDISNKINKKIKINRVNLYDIIGILKKSMEYNFFGEVFNVTDNRPLSREEITSIKLLIKNHEKVILEDSKMFNNIVNVGKKVSNLKVKNSLNYIYKYPDCIKYILEN